MFPSFPPVYGGAAEGQVLPSAAVNSHSSLRGKGVVKPKFFSQFWQKKQLLSCDYLQITIDNMLIQTVASITFLIKKTLSSTISINYKQ